jgi:polyisoprenyl-phosphate glycosyltransferase
VSATATSGTAPTSSPDAPSEPDEGIHISVVSPVYRAEACLEELHRRIAAALEPLNESFEIILVEDCGPDASWAVIERIASEDPRVRGLQLTRNFGQHHAVTAGLEASRGEWVVVMDCDLQDRPEEIPAMLAKAKEDGLHCVLARRAQRSDSLFKRLQSRAFYWVFCALTDLDYDGAVSNFGVASRQVIDDVLQMREAVRYYPGFLYWLGYATAFHDVAHDPRFAGETSYTFWKLLRHSQVIILAHSNKPLYLCVAAGFMVALTSIVAGLCYLVYVALYGSRVEGWPSLMISIFFSTGAIVSTLGLLGLYLGQIFTEVKRRPLYVVRRSTYSD